MRMSSIAFIDLDGVVANSDQRFALAERTANAKHQKELSRGAWTDLYWRTVFDSANVHMDMPIDGAYDALSRIEEDYDVHFLTSRPEYMRTATIAWLKEHRLMGLARDLIMKPVSQQFVKTVVWKVGMIHAIASMYGASEVLVIDDEQVNRNEVEKYTMLYTVRTYSSLALLKAMAAGQPDGLGDIDDGPF